MHSRTHPSVFRFPLGIFCACTENRHRAGCQAAVIISELNNKLTPIHRSPQTIHFKMLLAAPSVWEESLYCKNDSKKRRASGCLQRNTKMSLFNNRTSELESFLRDSRPWTSQSINSKSASPVRYDLSPKATFERSE